MNHSWQFVFKKKKLEIFLKKVCGIEKSCIFAAQFASGNPANRIPDCRRQAEIAQLVEHDLAKVGVASSSLVFRSKPGGVSGAARAEANEV